MPSQKRQSFRNSVNIFTSFKPFSFGTERTSGNSKKNTTGEKPGIENLPSRILLEILDYLPIFDLFSISRTSIRLSSLFYEEEIYLRKLRLMGVEWSPPSNKDPLTEPDAANESLPARCNADKNFLPSAREEFIKQYNELIPFYIDFRKTGSRDFLAFNSTRDLAEIGTLIARLKRFSEIQPVKDTSKIKLTLEAVYYGFESSMLNQFEAAYDEEDVDEMKKLAQVLINLTGGYSCFHIFIHKSELFYENHFKPRQNFYEDLDQTQAMASITFQPLEELASYLFQAMTREYSLIQQVFPEESCVFDKLLERVFQEIMRPYIAELIDMAFEIDAKTYFRALMSSFYHCTVLSEDIVKSTPNPAQRKAYLFTLFEPFIEDYVTREAKELESQYDTWIKLWSKKLDELRIVDESEAPKKKSMFEGVNVAIFKKNWLKKTTKSLSTESGNTRAKKGRSHQLEVLNLDKGESSNYEENATFQLNDLQLLLSIEMALHMINFNKEALHRCACFAGAPDDSPVKKLTYNCIERIFILLLKKLCVGNIEPGYSIATERLGAYKADFDSATESVAPILEFFELVHIGDLILQMVDVYYKQEVCQFVDPNDFLSEAVNEKRQFERVLDDCVAAGLDKSIEALMQQTEFILRSKQVPTEFLPSEKVNPDLKPTQACVEAVGCLATHTKLVVGGIDKQTLDVFLAEIGYRFFGLLGKHIKRFTINEAGGFQLIR
ncbi:F-box protein: endocytic membrane traffic, recycling ReCYcling 1, variant 2 [Basidiobolus ranarum]|uniref:F-box protein: endocytic membrane traffic, recycling ReCYcling 1, variant 2 n=1 Tax=Basidiobolus ranarum TaxID=34480 RepID=A0ABR2W720_9FUNG